MFLFAYIMFRRKFLIIYYFKYILFSLILAKNLLIIRKYSNLIFNIIREENQFFILIIFLETYINNDYVIYSNIFL